METLNILKVSFMEMPSQHQLLELEEISLHTSNKNMRLQFSLILISTLNFYICAQTVTLAVHQNYIPVITQHEDTLRSSISLGNQWYKNDVAIEGATGQTYVYKEPAIYKVTVTYENPNCSTSSESLDIKTALDPVFKGDINYKIFPNPNHGRFNVYTSTLSSGLIHLELFTIDGKLIMHHKQYIFSNSQTIPFGNDNLEVGLYTLRIHTISCIVNQLIIVQ
ncbi:MAG: T9SS type A sorting domain-containing protein [Paludibacter sp.]|nr:T9SS type A sorting domain-containing protein [Paludibacter sp.]